MFEPLLIKINLSFTYKLSVLTNDAVPLTVKSPLTIKLLPNVELPVTDKPPAEIEALVAIVTVVPSSLMLLFATPLPLTHLGT